MKLINELFFPGNFVLLTAPVAAGKTRLIIDFYRESKMKLVFVSPLRALANEVWSKLNKEHRHIYITGGDGPLEVAMTNFLQAKKAVLVATMELLHEEFLEACAEQSESVVFVLDEFHLFYHWGESFRPILHDRFLAILNSNLPTLALSATMSEAMIERLKTDLNFHSDFWVFLDFGNHQLFRKPCAYHYFSKIEQKMFYRLFWRELQHKNKSHVFLFFCAFRSEVDEMVERARRLGFKSIGCVGGEVETFLEQMKTINDQVDIIFCTSTLSHGVNLPEVKKVFIGHEVKNYDFWLQMVGRGGRQGGRYEVYTFDKFHFSKRNYFKTKVSHYFLDWTVI